MPSACEALPPPPATALSTPWHNVGPRHRGELVCIVWRTLSSSGPQADNQPTHDHTAPRWHVDAHAGKVAAESTTRCLAIRQQLLADRADGSHRAAYGLLEKKAAK